MNWNISPVQAAFNKQNGAKQQAQNKGHPPGGFAALLQKAAMDYSAHHQPDGFSAHRVPGQNATALEITVLLNRLNHVNSELLNYVSSKS